jgi:hypothetical protein
LLFVQLRIALSESCFAFTEAKGNPHFYFEAPKYGENMLVFQ